MSKLTPVRFVDVAIEGDFWRERLETVLTRTIPSNPVETYRRLRSNVAFASCSTRSGSAAWRQYATA